MDTSVKTTCQDTSSLSARFLCLNSKMVAALPCFDCPHRTRQPYNKTNLKKGSIRTTKPKTIQDRIGEGAGTELVILLQRKAFQLIGVRIKKTCSCLKHAKEMNQKGIDWCKDNLELICSWLEEQHEKQKIKLPFNEKIAHLLVRWAIRKAEKKT